MAAYKKGDLCRVRAKAYHHFEDGTIVRILSEQRPGVFDCANAGDGRPKSQIVYAEDLIPYTPQREKIVIATDGKTTTATLYEGKQRKADAKSTCSPDDTFRFATGAKLAVDRLLGVKPEKPKLFPLEDIKAGYLLEVKEKGRKTPYYMTVTCGLYLRSGREEEGLVCCSPGEEWWPMSSFDANLTYPSVQGEPKITAVYGLTKSRFVLDNTPEHRDRLWRRGE